MKVLAIVAVVVVVALSNRSADINVDARMEAAAGLFRRASLTGEQAAHSTIRMIEFVAGAADHPEQPS